MITENVLSLTSASDLTTLTAQMEYIIGEGTESDPHSIPLSTRDGSHIPNYQRREESPEVRRGAIAMFEHEHGAADNCVGHLFAARRTWIESDYVGTILERDGYSKAT